MKPTEAQIKEFWEWCGLQVRVVNYENDRWVEWLDPKDIFISRVAPPIDLNNLFKYAPEYQQVIFQTGYCGITIEDKLYEGSGDTEEDALFWALDKVRINEVSNNLC